MKTQPAEQSSATFSDNLYKPLKKRFIKAFLSTLRHTEHRVFVMLVHLPVEQFALVRYYDYKRDKAGESRDATPDYYTVQNFYRSAAMFHKYDEFRILFGNNILYFEEELTICKITNMYEIFLRACCEKGLRENKPLCLTRELAVKYRLTREDIRIVRSVLDESNAAARAKIQAEYDALKALDCVSK